MIQGDWIWGPHISGVIDEVNEADAVVSWASDVWTFSTQASLLIDGFETYNDDTVAETTIWHTWLDGLTDPAVYGGSQVGHYESPFCEQTIVRTGAQSMPLYYDNTGRILLLRGGACPSIRLRIGRSTVSRP